VIGFEAIQDLPVNIFLAKLFDSKAGAVLKHFDKILSWSR